jgi:hypothetical protein
MQRAERWLETEPLHDQINYTLLRFVEGVLHPDRVDGSKAPSHLLKSSGQLVECVGKGHGKLCAVEARAA